MSGFYEFRTYTAMPAKMAAMVDRFAKHTLKYLARNGIKVVAFWEPMTGANNQIRYIIEWADMAEFERCWKAFRSDPDWIAARAATETDGPLVEVVHNELWRMSSFSPPLHKG